MTQNLPDDFLELLEKVKGKRAKLVIKLILEKGTVTTEDLERAGYSHPPRAIRDVRENGIPLETIRIKGENGKSIAAYRFGDPTKIDAHKLGGRQTFSKSFKEELFQSQGGKCAICNEEYDPIYLQIDHRVPYEFMADEDVLQVKNFMLLCATCNRKKDRATITECSKTCFLTKDLEVIKSCYWASPENYTHICMKPVRQSDITWSGSGEVELYEKLKKDAQDNDLSLNDYIKEKLRS